MAKLENIVRPVVFPNIRPPARVRSIEEETGDDDGEYVIRGGSGGFIDLPYSWSVNVSRSRNTEKKRKVDVARIYQKEDDGTINKDNFIDVEVINKIWVDTPGARGTDTSGPGFGAPGAAGEGGPGGGEHPGYNPAMGDGSASSMEPTFYKRLQELNNIEIKERNKIIENPNYKPS